MKSLLKKLTIAAGVAIVLLTALIYLAGPTGMREMAPPEASVAAVAPPPPDVPPASEPAMAAPSVESVKDVRTPVKTKSARVPHRRFAPAAADGAPAAVVPRASEISPEYAEDRQRLARRDAYLSSLQQGGYAFNTPSPVDVGRASSVQFWLDPRGDTEQLARDLKAALRGLGGPAEPGVESGAVEWSPRMRAVLSGEDFDIVPGEGKDFDGIKDLSASLRTSWAWDVRARKPGEALLLHLRVWAVLPEHLGEPREIIKLDRPIRVQATAPWLIDTYWEKYWKWLLGGLGSTLTAVIAWWWQHRGKGA